MVEIVFPAAILQPPFFDPKADPAVNYGGLHQRARARLERRDIGGRPPVGQLALGIELRSLVIANFGMVEIVFPAAILQPPFFDPKADPAVNYGGIGAGS
jgi:hypothetical protein